jgi:hypothetical protein
MRAMQKPASASTKLILATILMPLAAGCTNVASGEAICDATAASRTAHAAALAEDGGDKSVITGAYLIQQIDAGCQ